MRGRTSSQLKKSMSKTLALGRFLLIAIIGGLPIAGQTGQAQNSRPGVTGATPAATASTQRALLDQYCVTCHNDKTKVDNFSLQKEDINAVGDHPEVWEKVIRKLRAGMMPPPGMP